MQERLRVGFLIAIVAAVYGNTLFNGFAQDDRIYILENHAVTAHSAREILLPNALSHVFRPLSFVTLSANWAVSGARPFTYHLCNVLLHAAATCLLYWLLRRLLEGLPRATEIAFVSGLLFAVHPIHTEAVGNVVGRSELLAAGFLFLAWLLYLRGRHVLALAGFALALLSKESAVVFLPLVVLTDYLRGSWQRTWRYFSLAGLVLLYVAIFWKVQGGRLGTVTPFLDNPLAGLPTGLRILNAFRVAAKYLSLLIYPSALSCDYSYDSITLYANWRAWLGALPMFVLFTVWLWSLFTRRGGWALAGGVYLIGFAATANILFPIGTIMGERLAYLPSAGFCLLIALLWARLGERRPRLALGVLAVVVAGLSLRTTLRNLDWRDDFTLYSSALRVVPGSAKMHNAIATEYASRGQPERAREEYQAALQIYGRYPEALESFGLFEASAGNDARARQLLTAAMSLAQRGSLNYDFAAVNLAAHQIKMSEYASALPLLNQVIADSPGYARAWANRAVLHYKRGELSSARSDAHMAVRLDPGNAQALNLLTLLESAAPGANAR
jgi:Tfp pilus assembly protein PilF